MDKVLLVLLGLLALAVAPVVIPGWLISRRRRAVAYEVAQAAPEPVRSPWWGLAGRERRTVRWLAAAEAVTHCRCDRVEAQLHRGLAEMEARLFRQLGLNQEEVAWVRLRTGEHRILSGVA